MKAKKIIAIFSSLLLAAAMTGCTGRIYTEDGSPISSAPVQESSVAESSVEESSEEESSTVESSEEESSAVESSEEELSEEELSEEESSEEESSEEESSEEESSEEESSEEESSEEQAEGLKITFVKPEEWETPVHAYVYNDDQKKNADWPGEEMTDNGDGTYSYVLPKDKVEEITSPQVIFNAGTKQYPRSGGLEVTDGTTYETE